MLPEKPTGQNIRVVEVAIVEGAQLAVHPAVGELADFGEAGLELAVLGHMENFGN